MLENPYFIPALVGSILVFQLLLLLQVARLSGKVGRLMRQLASRESFPVHGADADLAGRKEAVSDQKNWFEVFLNEDPQRRELPKKEQFAAFRQWREERGMNWKA
ncbi:hypothetical protein OJ996_13600 [Luteolibacter sp. GHJ8]|uniref:Uncharacterized protein n=1 Tax=Luteolibacter rhizosphaerae TaxID=2989719 RepID=A0ABT3G453_9BACT|nr:hypothetical protein [Luteolibacter rhizosphaerae]MCW1914617.1 hypothetical protein [Luteolibacter rhizosphaerae]